jgi:tetratricopeptide (TPR) repeat protein
MAKKKETAEKPIVAVEEALSKTEQYIEKNQKVITIIIGAIVVIVLGYFAFQKFYVAPKEKEAQSEMFMAEKYFEKDSLKKALYGDGYNKGFLDIIDDYGVTKSADLSHYYAGLCFLNLGQFEEAIKHLKKFDGKDKLVSGMAMGAIGDAYMELGNLSKAESYYKDAAERNVNEFLTPAFLLKLAWTYELEEKWDKALPVFEKIKKDYPRSREMQEVEVHISRAKALLGKE